MKEKPQAPEHEKIEEAMQNLRALGVTGFQLETPEDRIHRSLIKLWKAHSRPPTISDLAADVELEPWQARHALSHLARSGRAIRIRRAVYVPVVEGGDKGC